MAYTAANVNTWYNAVQYKNGSEANVASFVAQLNAGSLTERQVQDAIKEESYTTGNVDPATRAYQGAFARVPDQGGLKYWTEQLAAKKVTTTDIGNWFANSTEFKTTYASTGADQQMNASILTALYQNILQRAPDAAGYDYWTGKTKPVIGPDGKPVVGPDGKPVTEFWKVGEVLSYFNESKEFVDNMAQPIRNWQQVEIDSAVAGKPVPTTGSLYDYGDGSTKDLTPNADTFTAQTFNGAQKVDNGVLLNTLNNGDKLTGSGTTTKLDATLNGGTIVTPEKLENIKTVILGGNGTGGILRFGADNLTGAKNLQIHDWNGPVTVSPLNDALTDLWITNQGPTAGGVATAVTVTTKDAALAGANDTLNLKINNFTGGGVLTINTTAATNNFETFNITSEGGVPNVLGGITTLQTANNQKFVIKGATNLTTGALSNSVNVVDASAFTGKLNVTMGNNVSTVTGGTADDIIQFGANFTSADKVDGGAGQNALVANATGLESVIAVDNNISNIQAIVESTAGTAGGVLNANLFGSAGINNVVFTAGTAGAYTVNFAAGGGTINDFAISAVPASSNTGVLTVTAAGTSTTDTFTLNLNPTTLGGVTGVTLNETIGGIVLNTAGAAIENLVINSTNAATTHTIGAITLPNTVNVNDTITMNGTSSITTTGPIAADILNASGLTGGAALIMGGAAPSGRAIVITGSATGGDTLIGSVGNDTITTGAGSTVVDGAGGADGILLGAGRDTVWFETAAASAAVTTANFGLVSGFAVGTTAAASDILSIDVVAASSPSAVGFLTFNLKAGGAITPGTALVEQDVAQNAAATAAGATTSFYKMTTAVGNPTGLTAQTLFNTAIGTATITGLNAAGDNQLVSIYDQTNQNAIFLSVNGGTTLGTGDTVTVLGQISMTAAQYGTFGANQIVFA